MLNKIGLILLLLLAIQNGYAKESKKARALFRIVKNGRVGFIDSLGELIIPTKFQSANDFSEGLASARVNGRYGFIDESGDFVIPPQFDYATFFSDGLGIVYNDGIPFYIDKTGKKVINSKFPFVSAFYNGRAKIGTVGKHQGYIDKNGKLIIDTIFSAIRPFVDGVAVVRRAESKQKTKGSKISNPDVAVIDTLGNFVIPFGKFDDITDFEDGYFKAKLTSPKANSLTGDNSLTIFLDKTGKVILTIRDTNNCYVCGNIHCGLVRMHLYKYWIPEKQGIISTSEKSYSGFADLNGQIIIDDTNYRYVEDFSNNRAFVQDGNRHFSVINTRGTVISNNIFSGVIENGYKNGLAFVSIDRKWGIIDTNAEFILKPTYDGIHRQGMIDDYFFFEQDDDSTDETLTGVALRNGQTIIPPIIQRFDNSGFNNGLLKCVVKNKLTYVSKNGKIIWQQNDSIAIKLPNLDIDFMNRGYFYAHSQRAKDENGGFGGSGNSSKKISKSDSFPETSLSVVVRSSLKDTFGLDYNGITVFVVNASSKTISFSAQDSRLDMKVQALNKRKQWADIEYLPSSWCGNSYHILSLEPKKYWTFITPIYSGEYKTKLRIKLEYIDKLASENDRRKSKTKTIYSNQYDGSINPGQFWRKTDYSPNGIMDPYND